MVLGHTTESDLADTETTPKNLREVEAEAVALLCCEALNLEGSAYCRGYIQNWLYRAVGFNGGGIPEKSAQKIFNAADQILRAGRLPAGDYQVNRARKVSSNVSDVNRIWQRGTNDALPRPIRTRRDTVR